MREAGRATLQIFDLQGRLVQALVEGDLGSGDHIADWDGRNERGDAVPAGVYFYRLTAPGYRQTFKMLLLQ